MKNEMYERISRDNNFDVVRLFAALQVCTGHLFYHYNISGGAFSHFLSNFPGVTIFFALSGFLITSSWCHSKSIAHYIKNRFLRIFPALFVCFVVLQLAMVCLGHITVTSLKDIQVWVYWLGQLTLGQYFTPDSLRDFGVGAPNGSLWTIPIEVEFYIILPCIFILLGKVNIKWKLITLALFSIVLNIVLSRYNTSPSHTNAAELIVQNHWALIVKLLSVSVFPYLYCFLTGSLIYLFWGKLKNLFINKAIYWIGLYLILIYVFDFKPSHAVTGSKVFISNLILACLSISSAFSFGKVYKWLYGIDISYGIYIIHMIVVNIFVDLGYGHNVYDALLTMLITIILALLLYIFVEKPALSLKKR